MKLPPWLPSCVVLLLGCGSSGEQLFTGAPGAGGASGTSTSSGTGAGTSTSSSGTTGTCEGGATCVAAPPGTIAVKRPAGDVCPGGWSQPLKLFEGADPGCPGCSCAPPGGHCSMQVTRYKNDECTDLDDGPTVNPAGTCVDVDTIINQAQGYKLEPLAMQSDCQPSQAPPEPAPPPVLACAEDATAGCGAAALCLADDDACMLLEGDVACPAELPLRRLVYDGQQDQRQCGCSCGAPQGGSCQGAAVTLYSNASCGQQKMATIAAPAGCANVSNQTSHDSYLIHGQLVAGSCPPADTSSGQIVYSGARTVCCRS